MDDDKVWREVREVAAQIGWADRAEILRVAHLRLKCAVPFVDLERLWKDRAEPTDPI
jgi:hypothetical protein